MMIIGFIKVRIENINNKYLFCRPVSLYSGEMHPSIIGVPHAVEVERCKLTEGYIIKDEISIFGIFSKRVTIEEFRRGYTVVKVSPIDRKVYERLKETYNKEDNEKNCFYVN